jgi:hypothetical protein
MKEFFEASPVLAWSLVSTMLALAVVSILWKKLNWWAHNTWFSFPLLGRISSLSRDPKRDSLDPSWFHAEKNLCSAYKKFIRIQDEHDFHEKVTYLTRAGDNGRKNTPALIWLLTVALVFVEAMGFSYVLAGYTIPGASENTQQMGAIGIAFLISAILVALTHFSGHELYKSGKIKNAEQQRNFSGHRGDVRTVALADRQSTDNGQPSFMQLMNRVGIDQTYIVSIVTAVFVCVVAIGATYVRGQVLEKQIHQQVTGQGAGADISAKLSRDTLDMSVKSSKPGIQLPVADAAQNRQADEKAAADDANIERHGGWGTFIVLAFIFVFLQILGVLFGFRWGFAGGDSQAAFHSIGSGRYSSYADVRQHYKDIADTAQSKLVDLQQRLMKKHSQIGTEGFRTSKTFYDFIDAERVRETAERAQELHHAMRRGAMELAQTGSLTKPLNAATLSDDIASPDTLHAALQKLHAMGDDKDAKKAYIQNLSEEVAGQVKQALKARKEAAASQVRQRDAELDDLLN